MIKTIAAFIAAVVATYLIAVISYSQLNLSNLVEMGIAVEIGTRWQTALHDLLGMGAIYLPIIAVGFAVAFGVARLVLIWLPQLRNLGYILAGFVAIFVILEALRVVGNGAHPLAVTRTMIGLLSQCVAGALGGWVFAFLSAPSQANRPS